LAVAAIIGLPVVSPACTHGAAAKPACSNLPNAAVSRFLLRLTGWPGPQGVELRKTSWIDAPMEHMWVLWDRYENFPCFMTNVREVPRCVDGDSH
jgi:hypothetical protein